MTAELCVACRQRQPMHGEDACSDCLVKADIFVGNDDKPQGQGARCLAPRGTKSELGRAVVVFLRRNMPASFMPVAITAALRLPKKQGKAVAQVCKRLSEPSVGTERPGPVVRIEGGRYRAWMSPADIARVEDAKPAVHALQLEARMRTEGWSPPGRTRARAPARASRARVHAREWAEAHGWHFVPGNSGAQLDAEWAGRLVTWQFWPHKGTLLISVEASKAPMEAPDLSRLTGYLQARFQDHGWTWQEPKVRQMEINRDMERVRMKDSDEVRAFVQSFGQVYRAGSTLDALEGVLVRLYNKAETGALRHEERWRPRTTELTISETTGLLATSLYGPRDRDMKPVADMTPAPAGADFSPSALNDQPDYSWV